MHPNLNQATFQKDISFPELSDSYSCMSTQYSAKPLLSGAVSDRGSEGSTPHISWKIGGEWGEFFKRYVNHIIIIFIKA